MNESFNRKTVAIFCPLLTGGGAERIAGLLSKELIPYVDKVYFFVLYRRKITYEYDGELICFDFDRIDAAYSKYGRFVVFCRKALEYMCLPKRMRQTKQKLGIDCTISFLDFPSIINILSRANDKIIASIRCPKTPQKQQSIGIISKLRTFVCHTLLRKYLNKADIVVSASYGIREDLEENFGVAAEKSRVVYNFLDQKRIDAIKEEEIEIEYKDFFENKFIFLCVGRLEKEKNHESVLNAFVKISRLYPDTGLVFVGEGSLRENLVGISRKQKIQEKVLFIPFTSNPYKYMARSNALILGSFYEGFPNVLMEAMCCGCPLISVDCVAGPREIIGDIVTYKTAIKDLQVFPRGVLYKQGKLWEAMRYVFENREKLQGMRECGRAYVQQYSNDKIIKQWLECIEGAAG